MSNAGYAGGAHHREAGLIFENPEL